MKIPPPKQMHLIARARSDSILRSLGAGKGDDDMPTIWDKIAEDSPEDAQQRTDGSVVVANCPLCEGMVLNPPLRQCPRCGVDLEDPFRADAGTIVVGHNISLVSPTRLR